MQTSHWLERPFTADTLALLSKPPLEQKTALERRLNCRPLSRVKQHCDGRWPTWRSGRSCWRRNSSTG